MRVLALIVPALVSTSGAVHGAATATATATRQVASAPEKMFNEKTKIPAFFMAACRDGKDSIIEHFLNAYPSYARDLNTRVPSSKNGGESCLHHAARNGHANIVDIMIKAGSDPNIKTNLDEYGTPPLYWAIVNGHYGTLKVLVRNDANVNQVFDSPQEKGKKITCYDALMDMIERIGVDREMVAKGSGEEDYYRMKEQLEERGAKRYEQLVVAANSQQNDVKTEL